MKLNRTGYFSTSYRVNQKYGSPRLISTYGRSDSLLSGSLALGRIRCMKLDRWLGNSHSCFSSKTDGENAGKDVDSTGDAQARVGEQDQTKKTGEEISSPISTRGSRFRNEFLRRIVPWEEINDSWDTFPYHIDERSKTDLLQCVASRLKHKQLARDYGERLASSGRRIMLQSFPGTLLYRDKLVRALAHEFQVPLLVLDSSVLPPYCLSEDGSYLDENDEESDSAFYHMESDEDESDYKKGRRRNKGSNCLLKKGDRVKYVGPITTIKANKRTILKGQKGEVHQVNGNNVAVIFYMSGPDDKSSASLSWLHVKHIKHDRDARIHDCYAALEVLCGVLESQQPLILYFPNSFTWLPWTASWNIRRDFVRKVKDMFGRLTGRVVLICGQDNWNDAYREMQKYPDLLKQLIEKLRGTRQYGYDEADKIFTNAMHIKTPEKEDLMKTFCEQIEEDMANVISRSNFNEMIKVLKKHNLLCTDLEHVDTNGLILTTKKAEKIIGWATNHHLSSCLLPCVEGEQLHVPRESLKLAISRLMEEEAKETKETEEQKSKKHSESLESFASGEYERALLSAVVRPDEIGVKFEDVGAHEYVKKTLHDLVILPMTRPELFSRGNLLRPCKGILLFGPPGTGKTLLAKALATEAKANFINVSNATLSSMWYGEAEKYAKALFSLAGKLAPAVIFIDEIESLLGARGRANEHEATRKLCNQFMASWDGLQSKENQRILVLGATNRPFDLDDAVIRRMPRRIHVDLPDVENRVKILKVLLAQENLESDFCIEQLAKATESYSGSDLKNLCIAAAYRPVEELLEEESKDNKTDGAPSLRPLKLDDFVHAKDKVTSSVSYNATSLIQLRQWNEQYGERVR